MLEFILELIKMIPTNYETFVFFEAVNAALLERTIIALPAAGLIGVLVAKTPWKWDDNLWTKIKSKLKIGTKGGN